VTVGEPAYYEPFGFVNAGAAGLRLPGPVAAHRFQVLDLAPGALTGLSGMIGRADARAIAPARSIARKIKTKAAH
jgi:predicted N-acetyltransferase YhbS